MNGLLILCVFLCSSSVFCLNDSLTDRKLTDKEQASFKEKVAKQLHILVEHFKQEDPIGLPEFPMPDPFPVPNFKGKFPPFDFQLSNAKVYGLPKFRLQKMDSNLADMKVFIFLSIEQILVRGDYVLYSFFNKQSGDSNITVYDLLIKAKVNLGVSSSGELEPQEINLDLSFKNISVSMPNFGVFSGIVKSLVDSIGPFVFEGIKPSVLQIGYSRVRQLLEENLSKLFPQKFPNSIPPLDMVISGMRKYAKKFDPLKIVDYNNTMGIFTVEVNHIWLVGLATFYRIGNITANIRNGTLYLGINLGTKQLMGSCNWELRVGIFPRTGTISFTAEYIQANFTVAQTLDVRNKPKLEDFNLKVGNVQMRVNGGGTVDYILEALVNIVPNVLRYQIVDAAEGPLKEIIQNQLDQLELEQSIDMYLPIVFEMMSVDKNENSDVNDIDY